MQLTGVASFRFSVALAILILLAPQYTLANNRIVVDTRKATLTVLDDDNRPLLVLDDISIGRFGARQGKTQGDGMTPLGSYRVTGIRKSKRFHYFISLDYPSLDDAKQGIKSGTITPQQAARIRSAHAKGDQPPQDTALGGYIGLHGIGIGDPKIHQLYNWTNGCIAVTDAQINRLLPLIERGTRTTIK